MEEKKLKQMYEGCFESQEYVKNFYDKPYAFPEFSLRNIHDFFSRGIVRGGTCIEIGCGPTVHSIASASKYCDKIITSDFLERNRDQVKLWLKRDPKSIDWSHIFKVLAEIEGFSNIEEGISQIQERVRSKISDVLHCDVWKEYPLEKPVDQCDVLITSLALESATEKPEDYSAAVRNICNHLKPGGKIIILGALNCTWYVVGKTRFPAACVTKDLVEKSLQSAGCVIESFEEIVRAYTSTGTPEDLTDSSIMFFCLAGKK